MSQESQSTSSSDVKSKFDLFLCHNSLDKQVVEDIAEQLLEKFQIRSWLDVWAIPAAADWEREIQKALEQCRASAVFLGANGWGSFHIKEAQFINQHNQPAHIVIPIQLPGAKKEDQEQVSDLFTKHQVVTFQDPVDSEAVERIGRSLGRDGPFPEGRPRLSPQVVRRDAARWKSKKAGSRDAASILYRGAALREASGLMQQYPGQFDRAAHEFLSASEAAQRHRLRRNSLVASVVAAIMTALSVGAVYSWYISKQLLSNSLTELGQGYIANGQMAEALPLFVEALAQDPNGNHGQRVHRLRLAALRGLEPKRMLFQDLKNIKAVALYDSERSVMAITEHHFVEWSRRSNGEPDRTFVLHEKNPNFAVFSPDNTRFATTHSNGRALVYEVATGLPVSLNSSHNGRINMGCFSWDGRQVATVGEDGSARVYSASTGEALMPPLDHGCGINFVSFSPQGDQLATCCSDGRVWIWNLRDQRGTSFTASEKNASIFFLEFNPAGDILATIGVDGAVHLLNTKTSEPIKPIFKSNQGVRHIQFSPIGDLLAIGQADGKIYLWDVPKGVMLSEPLQLERAADKVCFSPDGQLVAAIGTDWFIQVWDTKTRLPLSLRLKSRCGTLTTQLERLIRFDVRGKQLLSVDNNATVRIWQIQRQPIQNLAVKDHNVRLSDDGSRLCLWAPDGRLKILTVSAEAQEIFSRKEPGTIGSVALDIHGTRLALASDDRIVRVFNVDSGQLEMTSSPLPGKLMNMAFSGDSDYLSCITGSEGQGGNAGITTLHIPKGRPTGPAISVNNTGIVHLACNSSRGIFNAPQARWAIFDIQTGELTKTWVDSLGFSFSPFAGRIATGHADKKARLWDACTGKQLGETRLHEGEVFTSEISRDGTLIATCCAGDYARIWASETMQAVTRPLKPVRQKFNEVMCHAAFNLDNMLLATGSNDGTVRIWDAKTGQEVIPPLELGEPIDTIRFSSDGGYLCILMDMQRLVIWPIKPDQRSPQQLKMWAEVSSSMRIDESMGIEALSPKELKERWIRYDSEFRSKEF